MTTRRNFIASMTAMGAALPAVSLASAPASAGKIAPPPAPAVVPAPAVSSGIVKWRLTSSFPKGLDTIYGAAETLARRVAEITENRFQIEVFEAGKIAPGLKAMDVVSAGEVECCHTASYYYVGKDKTFGIGSSIPFGMNARQMNAWLYFGNGQKLLDDFYADHGFRGFAGGNTGTQMGGWFVKEIQTLNDLKGLKMRIAGLGGEVLRKLGGQTIQTTGPEIIKAFEEKRIDAAEWVGPYDDFKLGLHKAAKNYYYPGWWEPGPCLHFFVNNKAWDKLPVQFQKAFEVAASEANVLMMALYDHKNPEALIKLTSAEHGVKLQKYPNEIMVAAYRAAMQIYHEEADKNPNWKRVWEPYFAYTKKLSEWHKTAEMRMDAFSQKNIY